MLKAKVVLDRDFVIGAVDPRVYSGFIEHLGRHIYTGIYEPGHPKADKNGFRKDVLDLVRQLQMPLIRYPGGNFVSGYNWEDGIGDPKKRPVRLDLAWHTIEPNTFGIHEFMNWLQLAGGDAMMAVNLGTRGPADAANIVEYCNHPEGTAWSDLRRKNGAKKPFGIKTWCLGNEMDGPWQTGRTTAHDYGVKAREAAKMMKWIDPGIELVVCGSSNMQMPTFGAWELGVLEEAYEHVDYLSLHQYFSNEAGDTPDFLGVTEGVAEYIEASVALCDAVAAKKKQTRKLMLSFDEWNVWFHSHGDREKHLAGPWKEAPALLEDIYTMEDALVVGSMLTTLVNHCDRVKIACIAQVVNVIAPIMTVPGGAAWAQSIFHPFRDVSMFGRGTALRAVVDSPKYDAASRDGVPYVTGAFVLSDDGKSLSVFAVNRNLESPVTLDVELRGLAGSLKKGTFSHSVLRHDNLKAVNTAKSPRTVAPSQLPDGVCANGRLTVALPPASWNVLRVAL